MSLLPYHKGNKTKFTNLLFPLIRVILFRVAKWNVISAVVKNENDPVVAYNEQHADDPKQFEIRVSIFGKKNG